MTTPNGRYPNPGRRYPTDGSPPDGSPPRDDPIRRLAPSRATVLLVGGSGKAKMRVARALHARSPRAPHPFVTIDCAALPPDAVEEALFGEVAYGGPSPLTSSRDPGGATRAAERGTLYVAAIDRLPLRVQPRFLRFLDEPRAVRVVASCDVDLVAAACEGGFRADLAERLALVRVDLALGRV
jgi:DNA-binding NtrC family response regulator